MGRTFLCCMRRRFFGMEINGGCSDGVWVFGVSDNERIVGVVCE